MDVYGRFGDIAEMEYVLIQMKDKGCKPDRITLSTMTKVYLSKVGYVIKWRTNA